MSFKVICVFVALLFLVKGQDTGCVLDGRKFEVGEQYDVLGYCVKNVCQTGNLWAKTACPLIGLPPGFTLTPEDHSKGFPDCCGKVVPSPQQ